MGLLSNLFRKKDTNQKAEEHINNSEEFYETDLDNVTAHKSKECEDFFKGLKVKPTIPNNSNKDPRKTSPLRDDSGR